MKKLVFALSMLFGAVVVVNAQDTTSTSSPTDPTVTEQPSQVSTSSQEDGRVKIKSQDLPDAVKSSLEGQEFRGWLVNSAYKVDNSSMSGQTETGSSTSESDSTNVSSSDPSSTGNTGVSAATGAKEIYIVELKNGAQTKTVRFDKDGKKLEDEGMQDDQK
jgi:hypothetical protein